MFYNYLSGRALSAMVPAAALDSLAARADVLNIAPNRATTRQGSLLQDSVGEGLALPGLSKKVALDGRGVGIATLDSGIDFRHQAFDDDKGQSRVRQAVDIVSFSRSIAPMSWVKGIDLSPAAAAMLRVGATEPTSGVLQPRAPTPDPHGHGTHVAAIAAGGEVAQAPAASPLAPTCTTYACRTSVAWAPSLMFWPASTG